MILIADGGTTKCDWVGCIDEGADVVFSTTTAGINPSYLPNNELASKISESDKLNSVHRDVEEIYFFGSGCGVGVYKKKLEGILSRFFINAKVIKVFSDITGAAYACTETGGVVAILGTGSNICFFDGKNVDFRIPSLGYILMDQGSGNAIGRKLLQGYFFNTMPYDYRNEFEEEFNLDLDYVKKRLYDAPGPSSFMGSFAIFLFKRLPHPYMVEMLVSTLEEFFDLSIASYSDKLEKEPLHFVGSIAYYSRDYIKNICFKRGIKLGKIEKKPIMNLPKRIKLFRQLKS